MAIIAIGCGNMGCGSDIPVGEAAARICEARASYASLCRSDDSFDVPACTSGRSSCVLTYMRSDALEPMAMCFEDRECGDNDDRCFSTEFLGIELSSDAQAYNTACLARRELCGREGVNYSDDNCFAGIANDDTIAEMNACIERPCSEVRDCYRAIVDC